METHEVAAHFMVSKEVIKGIKKAVFVSYFFTENFKWGGHMLEGKIDKL